MGMTILPENILKRMSPRDRSPLGKAGRTRAEANAACDRLRERELQDQIAQFLNLRDVHFSRSRMDRKTTVAKGYYDFSIVLPGGRHLAVEVKVPGGVISEDQKRLFDRYWDQTHHVVHIVFSLEQFVRLLDEQLAHAS